MSVNPEHVVLVTGGAGGIGLEIVRHLIVDHGAGVVATDLVEGELGSLKQQYPANLRVVLGNIVDVGSARPRPFKRHGSNSILTNAQKAQNIGTLCGNCSEGLREIDCCLSECWSFRAMLSHRKLNG